MNQSSDLSNHPRWVQSCITSVSFPETLANVLHMVEGNQDMPDWATDMDTLLHFDPTIGYSWTAPKWITQGDLLFFYHTKNARQRTMRLLNQARSMLTP